MIFHFSRGYLQAPQSAELWTFKSNLRNSISSLVSYSGENRLHFPKLLSLSSMNAGFQVKSITYSLAACGIETKLDSSQYGENKVLPIALPLAALKPHTVFY